ncbi:MAG: hypothetical protein KAK00_07080 [Nanoarchaeota archaeon]|nr:hypothetical protein [Nanoarchaeota archaeon]
MEYYKKGKRGIIHTTDYKGKKIAVKSKNPKSEALSRIEIEASFLKKLNKKEIGPKFLFFKNNCLGMEFIDGIFFQDYIEKEDKKQIKKVIENLLNQLYTLDKLKINKEEMHHPVKHIIIRKDMPYLIDFERCHYTEKPKNMTQFIQYLTGRNISARLKEKGIMINKNTLTKIAKKYKKGINKENFLSLTKNI